MITLVIGLRGTGKTTWCREHLGEYGLCYDLDAIASAFRLKQPHEEYHQQARWMANDILYGFITQAWQYTENILVIRTAPSIQEFREINPDVVVYCKHQYIKRGMDDETAAKQRIRQIISYCGRAGVTVITN